MNFHVFVEKMLTAADFKGPGTQFMHFSNLHIPRYLLSSFMSLALVQHTALGLSPVSLWEPSKRPSLNRVKICQKIMSFLFVNLSITYHTNACICEWSTLLQSRIFGLLNFLFFISSALQIDIIPLLVTMNKKLKKKDRLNKTFGGHNKTTWLKLVLWHSLCK